MADLLDFALTTVADVKESLGISGNSQDNLIIRNINRATMAIESYCNLNLNHHFKEATYTDEVYDGTGTDQVVLRMRPVSSVAAFEYRQSPLNEGDWDSVESELFFLDGQAGTLDGLFRQRGNYSELRVTYTAGYSPIPADLAEAACTLASFWTQNSQAGTAVKRQREGQREIEYFNAFNANGGGNNSVIESLGLDDVLSRYMFYAV